MDASLPEFQYLSGQMRDSFAALFQDFERRNEQALRLPHWSLDVPYGDHPREVFDTRPADGPSRGTLVYWHAGYWQTRDKAQFRFLAPRFNALGWDVALINYPLCPEVGVADIVRSARRAWGAVMARQAARGVSGPSVLCGHSAGAHLAVEVALQAAAASEARMAGVIGISGVFDLRPLVQTSLNVRLQLDDATAEACSPHGRVRAGVAPALFVLGETETPAFHAQTQAMAEAWQSQGHATQVVSVAGADHFSVLDHLTDAAGPVARCLQAWSAASV